MNVPISFNNFPKTLKNLPELWNHFFSETRCAVATAPRVPPGTFVAQIAVLCGPVRIKGNQKDSLAIAR